MGQQLMVSPIPSRPPAPGSVPNTGVIRGRLVSTDGRPLPHAQVQTLSRVAAATPNDSGRFQSLPVMVTADEEGRYELSDTTPRR